MVHSGLFLVMKNAFREKTVSMFALKLFGGPKPIHYFFSFASIESKGSTRKNHAIFIKSLNNLLTRVIYKFTYKLLFHRNLTGSAETDSAYWQTL